MKKNIFEGLSVKTVRTADVHSYLQILDGLKDVLESCSTGCFTCDNEMDMDKFFEISPRFDAEELRLVHDWFKLNGPRDLCGYQQIVQRLADSEESRRKYVDKLSEERRAREEVALREKRRAELPGEIAELLASLEVKQAELSLLESTS